MEKSADAFRTISEVAEDLGLPQHVLRFWESRFPQIRPLKRAGGRRYYRPSDVDLLRAVRQLLYDDGYTIKGVQRLLKERGAKAVFAGTRPGVGDEVDSIGVEAVDELGRDHSPGDLAGYDRPAAAWNPDHGADLDRPPGTAELRESERQYALSVALEAVEACERILNAARSPSA